MTRAQPRIIVLPETHIRALAKDDPKFGPSGIQDGKTPDEIEKAIRCTMVCNGIAAAWCRKDSRPYHRQMQYSALVPEHATTEEMMGHMMKAENQNGSV